MIEIKKGREPKELVTYKQTVGASYDNMHGAPSGKFKSDGTPISVYDIVLESLIEEQGGLCAYCMKSIPEKRNNPNATIEHIKTQSQCEMEGDLSGPLDYRNMLAVCSGNRNSTSNDDKTCDARRQNSPLTLNPLIPNTLKSIKYKNDGIIYSDDNSINMQLNDVLNLNCKTLQLPDTRKSVLDTMLNQLRKNYPKGDINTHLKRLLNHYQTQSPKEPYVGIIIWWLKKHIHN